MYNYTKTTLLYYRLWIPTALQYTRELPDFPFLGYEFAAGPRLDEVCLPWHYAYPKHAPWREEMDLILLDFLEMGLDQKFFQEWVQCYFVIFLQQLLQGNNRLSFFESFETI